MYNYNLYWGIDVIYFTLSNKKLIEPVKEISFLDRIDAYRIVTYQHQSFSVWNGDGRTYQGLVAHEAQAVNPCAAIGSKDAVGEGGEPIIQQLDQMALITDLMGAVEELPAELSALKASLQPAAD